MGDGLDVYQRPADLRFPLVCFDETPVQLVSETRTPLPILPGKPAYYDCEYRREGTDNLVMFFGTLFNGGLVKVTNRRMKKD
jgi:hypothetical protein